MYTNRVSGNIFLVKSPANIFRERIQQECTTVMSLELVPHLVLPDVSRTDWKQHVSAVWEKKNGQERRHDLKTERERDRERREIPPHFLSLFIAVRYVWNVPTKAEGPFDPCFPPQPLQFLTSCHVQSPMDHSHTNGLKQHRRRTGCAAHG